MLLLRVSSTHHSWLVCLHMIYVAGGCLDCCSILMSYGADVTAKTNDGSVYLVSAWKPHCNPPVVHHAALLGQTKALPGRRGFYREASRSAKGIDVCVVKRL